MKKPQNKETVRLRLAGLCSRSEQCEYDLRLKISRAGLSAEDADDIIGFLKRERFLDDARFARSYAADKVRFSGWGFAKIRRGLIAKRIPATLIEEGISAVDRSEYIEALRRAGNAKARGLDMSDPSARAKFYRHMLSRGFEPELINQMLGYLDRR